MIRRNGNSLWILVGLSLFLPLLPAGRVVAGEASSSAGRFYVYVSLGADEKISIFKMNPETGELTFQENVEVEGAPGALVTGPDRKFLYAAIRSTESVSTLRIDPQSGRLSLVETVPVADNPVYLAVDHTGQHLLMASYGGDKAAVYPIGDEGTVDREATQILETDRNPHSILMDASNRFVYVPNTGADTIFQYKLDEEAGTLSPADVPKIATEEGAGPRHFFFHPNNRLVYFVNEKNSSVTAYRMDKETGNLTPFQTLPTLPADFEERNTCADIEITPCGKFLYASNRGHDSLAGYSIDEATGELTPLGQQPTEQTPRSFNIDPTGNFLFAAGEASHRLASYRIDPATGELRPLKVYPVGQRPAWVLTVEMPGEASE